MFKETYYPEKVEFEASVSLESNNLPDPYCYDLLDGKLFSPVTRTLVEKEITRRDLIEEAEYQAFQTIQAWFARSHKGTAVWISPSSTSKEDYDASKMIFSDIVYDSSRKRLRNRSLRFDWNSQDCLAFAERIGFPGGNLRSTPFFLGPEIQIADILEPYTPGLAQLIREDEDFKIKERLKDQIARGYPVPIGSFSLTCGRASASAFNLMYADSLNLSEAYFDCPRCNGPIPSGSGITTCPHCGARKEDYKSCK